MACFFPQTWFVSSSGQWVAAAKAGMDIVDQVEAACDQCEGCRKARAAAWALRGRHELQGHQEASFLTLTYDNEHLPPGNSLRYSDVQRFFKRVRSAGFPFRFLVCGEYGDEYGRAHYHAIIFGQSFTEGAELLAASKGHTLYRSPFLVEKWGMGHVGVGSVTPQSIGYVTSYCMEKVTGKAAAKHYACAPFIDADSGELRTSRTPEFLHTSMRPGIGARFADEFASDFQHGYIVADGRKCPIPTYYRRRFLQGDDQRMVDAMEAAQLESYKRNHTVEALADSTPERLAVRRQVFLAKPYFQRSLKAQS